MGVKGAESLALQSEEEVRDRHREKKILVLKYLQLLRLLWTQKV